VLAYLSRYAHRIAIANSRLVTFDGERVTFKWKDYRAKGEARYKLYRGAEPAGSSIGIFEAGPSGSDTPSIPRSRGLEPERCGSPFLFDRVKKLASPPIP